VLRAFQPASSNGAAIRFGLSPFSHTAICLSRTVQILRILTRTLALLAASLTLLAVAPNRALGAAGDLDTLDANVVGSYVLPGAGGGTLHSLWSPLAMPAARWPAAPPPAAPWASGGRQPVVAQKVSRLYN